MPATGIGDTVQFNPVIRNLRRAFPDARLRVVAVHAGCDTPEKERGQGPFGALVSSVLETVEGVGVIFLGGPGEDAGPVLALFGPSDPRRTAPWAPGGSVTIMRTGIECSPCYQLYSGRISCRFGPGDIRCMKDIAPDEVLEKVTGLLRATPARSSSS